jgi:hypothetical protein
MLSQRQTSCQALGDTLRLGHGERVCGGIGRLDGSSRQAHGSAAEHDRWWYLSLQLLGLKVAAGALR